MPREILAQGQVSIALFALSLIAVSIVSGVVTLLLLERIVLSRLARLDADVSAISTSGDISSRLAVVGHDELARLGARINEMLAALELAQEARQQSDERVRMVVNSAPLILLALDLDRRFTLVDGTGLKALGLEANAIVGKTVAELDHQLPVAQDAIAQALAGEAVSSTVTVNDLIFVTQYTPLRDRTERITGAIGVATNITERVLAESALSEANQQLEQQNHLLERAQELIHSSVEQLSEAVLRGASSDELRTLVTFMRTYSNTNSG
jgi:PAS domain S-box-containing protein